MSKRYEKEFKLNAVKLVTEHRKSAAQVSRELGVSYKTLCGWIAEYKSDPVSPFVGSGNLKPEA